MKHSILKTCSCRISSSNNQFFSNHLRLQGNYPCSLFLCRIIDFFHIKYNKILTLRQMLFGNKLFIFANRIASIICQARKQRGQVSCSSPDRYLFCLCHKATSLFSTNCILGIILPRLLTQITQPFDANNDIH